MAPHVPYDDFVDIYDVWCETAPFTHENKRFYVDLMSESPPPVVELGVGNGRICIEVARRGQHVYGVDSSEKILGLCRSRAQAAGVTERLKLVHADFRDFKLPDPAELITIPFHSIGHLMSRDDKRAALKNIREQLVPGGRFVFDHFVFDPNYPVPAGVPNLRAEYTDPETGKDRLIWETSIRDVELQVIHLVVCTEDLDTNGLVEKRRYRRTDLSWMSPEESRHLLEETGFEIEACYGNFDLEPLEASSPEQIWVARRG